MDSPRLLASLGPVLALSVVAFPALADEDQRVQCTGFSADGRFAAVRRTVRRQATDDKASGTWAEFALDYLVSLPAGEVLGVWQAGRMKAVTFDSTERPATEAARFALAPEHSAAAPAEAFSKVAARFGIALRPGPREPAHRFVADPAAVSVTSRERGVAAEVTALGEHEVRLVQGEGAQERVLTRLSVRRSERACRVQGAVEPTHTTTSEVLELELVQGPLAPIVLWRRTTRTRHCPDVQSSGSAQVTAGWVGVGP